MMKKWLLLFLFIICWAGAGLAILSVKEKQDFCNSTLPIHINRIVSAAPNLTEILFSLGMEEEIVGVTAHCNYPAAASKKAQIGTFWQPDIESVIAAKPDLVITAGFQQQKHLAERLNLYSGFDEKRKCKIVSINRLRSEINKIKDSWPDLVLDGHYSHLIPHDLLIILRTDLKELKKRTGG